MTMKPKYPCISIDRQSKKFAIFEDNVGTTSEEEAIRIGRQRLAEITDEKPDIVYPFIRKITCTETRRKL
jgi:hypothetical protein